jgi:hypothetical protein
MMAGRDAPENLATTVDAARILGLWSDMVRLPVARKAQLKAAIQTVQNLERQERGNGRRRP